MTLPSELAALADLRSLSLSQALERYGLPPSAVAGDAVYGRAGGLVRVAEAGLTPGLLFFDPAGRFVLLHVHEPRVLDGLDAEALRRALGPPASTLRSRAGKRFVHEVHPSEGVALSTWQDEVAFVDVFLPGGEYPYEEPGEFVK